MKLISLNTWGGRQYKLLLDFFQRNQDIDIFCLQEIYNGVKKERLDRDFLNDAFNLYSDLKKVFPGHVGYFRPHIEDWYGLAIFVKKGIQVKREGDLMIYDIEYGGGGNHPRNLQYIEFEKGGITYTVANVHGLWVGKIGKIDTPERLAQSEKIMSFMNSVQGNKILCGDFNLLPNTESVKIIEKDLRNLIKEYNIQSTRTSFYNKPDKHADFIFVNSELKVKDFRILPDEVSDHAAMLIEF